MNEKPASSIVAGAIMGGGAILLWSLSTVGTVFVGKQLGVWQFLATTALLSGLFQVLGYRVLGRTLRSILMPPPKLWIAMFAGFILYLLMYSTALVTSRTEAQAMAVNLMNYLWPMLAVLFTTWMVPGERMHPRLAVAIALSLTAVLLASGVDLALPDFRGTLRPYLLGGGAAVSWAGYCALSSRWRSWAKDYAVGPLGFLIVGAIGAALCGVRHEWQPMTARTWAGVLLTALGPWAGAYMLWELALHRVSGITLGLMGAVTPVLSTLNLIVLFALTAPGRISATRIAAMIAAACLVSVAITLGTLPARKPARA